MSNVDNRIWLRIRPDIEGYLREIVGQAIRSDEDFPPGSSVTIRGLNHVRQADGSVPFQIVLNGLVGPVTDLDRIPIKLQNIWDTGPIGPEGRSVKLGLLFSTGATGNQKVRMYLEFEGENNEDDYEDDQF